MDNLHETNDTDLFHLGKNNDISEKDLDTKKVLDRNEFVDLKRENISNGNKIMIAVNNTDPKINRLQNAVGCILCDCVHHNFFLLK